MKGYPRTNLKRKQIGLGSKLLLDQYTKIGLGRRQKERRDI